MKCRVEAKVIPGASRTEISGWLGDSLKIKVAAPPEKGKANQAVIRLLAGKLGLPSQSITVIKGETSQRKTLEIDGLSLEQLHSALAGD